MRWLKGLVVVLAAMIVTAVGLLGYGFVKSTGDPEWRLFGGAVKVTAPAAPTAPAIEPWGDLSLGLPAGCRIVAVEPRRRLAYLTVGPDGDCHRLVIVDVVRGRVVGTVRL